MGTKRDEMFARKEVMDEVASRVGGLALEAVREAMFGMPATTRDEMMNLRRVVEELEGLIEEELKR